MNRRQCAFGRGARHVLLAAIAEDQHGERDLALLPLTRVLIALDLEAATGISIPLDALIDVETVGDWIDLLTRLAEAGTRAVALD
jgi:hypothetical protein